MQFVWFLEHSKLADYIALYIGAGEVRKGNRLNAKEQQSGWTPIGKCCLSSCIPLKGYLLYDRIIIRGKTISWVLIFNCFWQGANALIKMLKLTLQALAFRCSDDSLMRPEESCLVEETLDFFKNHPSSDRWFHLIWNFGRLVGLFTSTAACTGDWRLRHLR